MSAQRVGVFSQNHIAHVVDQIILIDGNESRRGTRAPHPNLSGDHVSVDRKQRFDCGGIDFVVRLRGVEQGAD